VTTLADDIHAELRTCVAAGTFPQVTYPAGVRTTSLTVNLTPQTFLAKPLSSTWSEPERNRSRGFSERRTWLWEVTLEFSREVDLEAFEDLNTNTMLRLPRTSSKPQVDLIFEEADYRHPPEQQPAAGTRVVYRVRAELSPL